MAVFSPIKDKMLAHGQNPAIIAAFERCFSSLESAGSNLLPESTIEAVSAIDNWNAIKQDYAAADSELLGACVIIKLNGGLGTSMGLTKAKSLLPVRDGQSFLDLIVKQFSALKVRHAKCPRLLFMNSFSTSADTLQALDKYVQQGLFAAGDVELMQNAVPKLLKQSLLPAECAQHPELEWCPPGHGDLYAALLGSGRLQELLDQGIKYAFISNSDNLGAVLDERLLSYFAASDSSFMMEVTRRSEADRKGGHLACRKSDGQLILREVAQTPDEDLPAFQDIERHRYFNTNSLWLRLDRLAELMQQHGQALPLPVIRNEKHLDPRDNSTPLVYQLEVAMGAAIECFSDAKAIEVDRQRFAPVKTTADLFALRSDAYELGEDGQMRLVPARNGQPPVIELDGKLHKFVDGMERLGEPSLVNVKRLRVRGDVRFDKGQVLSGELDIEA